MADVECVNNFSEVKKDIDANIAKNLASKCLNCSKPMCVQGCPLGIDIPKFIQKIKKEDYEGAFKIISEKSLMPEVCGRVCPQELTCEAKCIRGLKGKAVNIGILERFASNYEEKISISKSNGYNVAIVGSGPAGLSCAYHLAKKGFSVTVYESSHKLGGVLKYGIPEFRLPKSIVDKIIARLMNLGVEFKTDILIGSTITLEQLKEEYDYIFIGTGAGIPKNLDIAGIMYKNVLSANELLTRVNLMKSPFSDTPLNKSRKAIVIGGGNVACDASRVLKRLGSEVTLCYRKEEKNLKMREEEYIHAQKENIKFLFNMIPVEIKCNEDYNISSVVFDYLGKRIELECDTLIIAIGTTRNKTVLKNSHLKTDEYDNIIVDDYFTSDKKILAGGDAISGSATVIEALKDGMLAAEKIIDIIDNK